MTVVNGWLGWRRRRKSDGVGAIFLYDSTGGEAEAVDGELGDSFLGSSPCRPNWYFIHSRPRWRPRRTPTTDPCNAILISRLLNNASPADALATGLYTISLCLCLLASAYILKHYLLSVAPLTLRSLRVSACSVPHPQPSSLNLASFAIQIK